MIIGTKRIAIFRLAFFLSLCVTIVWAVSYGFKLKTAEATRIPPGVFVQDIDISNLEKQQAAEKLVLLEQELLNKQVNILYEKNSWSIPLKDMGIRVNIDDTLSKALDNDVNVLIKRVKTYLHPVKTQVSLALVVDKQKLAQAVEPISKKIERSPVNAKLTITDQGKVTLESDQNGLKINMGNLQQEMLALDLQQSQFNVNLKVDKVTADKTLKDIETYKINSKLSEFTTNFDAKNVNRTINIKTAASKINKLVLAPGQEFSFNKVVGERTSKSGYKSAGVIVGNKLEEDLGGGICQVSTTLYNAILMANLTPVERHNHSLAIAYVPLGRDAAVSWGQLDFKFRNKLPSHVYLKTIVGQGHITVQVYGDKAQKKDITIRSWVTETMETDEVIKEEDPTLAPDQEVTVSPAHPGFKAQAERVIKENGVVTKESLPQSYYRPKPKVVKVGPQVTDAGHVQTQLKNKKEPTKNHDAAQREL